MLAEVSIPSERESISKGRLWKGWSRKWSSFNSLRTGKHIQRLTHLLIIIAICVGFQFPPNGKAYPKVNVTQKLETKAAKFQFPPNGKAYPKMVEELKRRYTGYISFNSLRTGKHIQRKRSKRVKKKKVQVSIPSERESISKETPFCTQSGRGSGYPKTKRELRGAFFTQKFIPKIPRTLVNIDPNAIFWQNRCGSQSASMFLDELSRAGGRGTNRVCFYKYTHNSEKSQIFCVLLFLCSF